MSVMHFWLSVLRVLTALSLLYSTVSATIQSQSATDKANIANLCPHMSQHNVTGVLIGVGQRISVSTAMNTRALSFVLGFKELGIPSQILELNEEAHIKRRLFNTSSDFDRCAYSHIILVMFPVNLRRLVMEPLASVIRKIDAMLVHDWVRNFRHVSLHVVAETFVDQEKKNESECHHFRTYVNKFHLDLVLPATQKKTEAWRQQRCLGNVSVETLPVPFATHKYYNANRSIKSINILFEYDLRPIFQQNEAEVMLRAIEKFRTSTLMPVVVHVINGKNFPESLSSITKVKILQPMFIDKFLKFVGTCQVYATAIRSSYENTVVESQMMGGILMSLPGIVIPELYDPSLALIPPSIPGTIYDPSDRGGRLLPGQESRYQEALVSLLNRTFIEIPHTSSHTSYAKVSARVHQWATERHSPAVVAQKYLQLVSSGGI